MVDVQAGVEVGLEVAVDGSSPKGVESEDDIAWRKGFLWQIGYKL